MTRSWNKAGVSLFSGVSLNVFYAWWGEWGACSKAPPVALAPAPPQKGKGNGGVAAGWAVVFAVSVSGILRAPLFWGVGSCLGEACACVWGVSSAFGRAGRQHPRQGTDPPQRSLAEEAEGRRGKGATRQGTEGRRIYDSKGGAREGKMENLTWAESAGAQKIKMRDSISVSRCNFRKTRPHSVRLRSLLVAWPTLLCDAIIL